jgi:hypothetical protein
MWGVCTPRSALRIDMAGRMDAHVFGAIKMTHVVRRFVVVRIYAVRPPAFEFPPWLDKRLHTEGPPPGHGRDNAERRQRGKP